MVLKNYKDIPEEYKELITARMKSATQRGLLLSG
jgi:hypothetical protein